MAANSENNPFLSPPIEVLRDFCDWLKSSHIPGLIIGGVAAAQIGRPRATQDVDATVWVDDEAAFLKQGKTFGFLPRRDDALKFARHSRVLLLVHQPTRINMDISLAALPFEREAIDRVQWQQVEDLKIPLPTPEDFIIMKMVAHRNRDIADIEAVLDLHAHLDLVRIRHWVQEFSAVLEMPELVDDLERLLSKHKP